MHTLLLSFIPIRCFCTATGETESPKRSLSIVNNNKKIANSLPSENPKGIPKLLKVRLSNSTLLSTSRGFDKPRSTREKELHYIRNPDRRYQTPRRRGKRRRQTPPVPAPKRRRSGSWVRVKSHSMIQLSVRRTTWKQRMHDYAEVACQEEGGS